MRCQDCFPWTLLLLLTFSPINSRKLLKSGSTFAEIMFIKPVRKVDRI